MKTRVSHNDFAPIGKLAASAGRGLMQASASGDLGDATRRQKKHEMLLTFMVNTKSKRRPAPVKPKLLTALLSIFF